MDLRLPLVTVILIGASACTRPAVDREAALKVSDAFMSDLVNDRIQSAVAKFEPSLFSLMKTEDVEAGVRALFNHCGRPLDMEYKADQIGSKLYPNGSRKPMRKVFYASKTTMHPKGICFFAVDIVPDGTELRVTTFGPLTLQSGKLPEWLK